MSYLVNYNPKKALLTIGVIGYLIGVLAGVGATYFTMKNKINANLESMAQQLRLCEEKLDK